MGARASVGLWLLLAAAASPVAAQFPDTLRPPASPGQTPAAVTPADTLAAADSAAAYLRLAARRNVKVPVLPWLAPSGPEPAAERLVVERDSLDWSGAQTVGDLLARVGGMYLWRGGQLGRPEMADFRGRGAASVEYELDGLPWVALGPDSLTADAALLPLSLLQRVEIERWPGGLRVLLFTQRHDRLAARSRISLAAGPNGAARYQVQFEGRSLSGFGIGAGADYTKVPPPGGASGEFQTTQLLAQGSYVPSERFGLQFQALRLSPRRDGFSSGGPPGARLQGDRTDLRARASVGGTGPWSPRLDLVLARAGWDSMGVDQHVNVAGGAASIRGRTFSARAQGYYRSRWTYFDGRSSFGWSPVTALTVSGEGVFQRIYGGRRSYWAGGHAELALPGGFSLGASGRIGRLVATPAVLNDTAQRLHEAEGTVAFRQPWGEFEASYARTAAVAPVAYQEFPSLPTLAPLPEMDWITLSGRLRPVPWLTLNGWYSNPRRGAPEGVASQLFAATGAIRTRLLGLFPSGALEIKAELGLEGWKDGLLARDSSGTAVALPAAVFVRSYLQVNLESFSVFWDSRNLTGNTQAFVPGFPIPRYSGIFGIRWTFWN